MNARTLFFLFAFVISLPSVAQKSDAEKFVGHWVCNDAGYEMEADFKADGSAVVDGDNVKWTAQAGSLSITVDGERKIYKYLFNDTGFRVSGGDLEAPLNFRKSRSASSPASDNVSSKTRKTIDKTLIGKWCYVNVATTNNGGSNAQECITIKENGTYEYYSERSSSGTNGGTASQVNDSGTWWIEGTRVHYDSQSQGLGSYELIKRNHPKTGDPMIVLDGTAYVTYFKKNSW